MDIVFSINNNYVNHLIVTLYSLIAQNKSHRLNIHVLSSDMTVKSKDAINLLKEMHPDIDINFYSIDAAEFKDFAITMNYITLETYYRLVLARILNLDKVLYLDADILINGDIEGLYSTDISNCYAAGVPDVYLNEDVEYKRMLNIEDSAYINAGVLLLNLRKIREDGKTEELVENAKRKNHKYQDQDAINVTFAGEILLVDKKYNYMIKDKQYHELPNDEMVILHYSGSFKPWNRDRLYDSFGELYDRVKLQSIKFIAARNKNIKYGLLKYSTDNVGDTIQGIAARKFLPRVDYYFERDNIDATKTEPGETVKVVINGWWGDAPENWPPMDQNLDILPISMYAEDRIQKEFQTPRSRTVLEAFGPIGARSHGTEEFLKSSGIDAYFSGCMTLTLNPDKTIKKRDYILAVDVSDAVYETMKQQTDRRIIRIGVLRQITTDVDEQHRLAEFYLYLYQSAHAVVTTRLHTMLPSIALGTPVLFINDILGHDDVRFSGLSELAYNLRSSDYVQNPKQYDIDTPPKNSDEYLKIRKSLESKVSSFTGYMGKNSFMTMPVSELALDDAFIQASIGGTSGLGDLIEERDKLANALKHKENHVVELARELDELRSKHESVIQSTSWKLTQPVRAAQRAIKRNHEA